MDPLHLLLFAVILAILALLNHRFSRFERMLEKALRKPAEPQRVANDTTPIPEQTPIPSTRPASANEDVLEVTHRLAKANADFDDEDERTKVYDSKR